MPLYPLKFTPRLVPKIWGGRKLQTVLNKALPAGERIGESWELYDFPPGVVEPTDRWVSAVVSNGPFAGRTLHELVSEFESELLGDVPALGNQKQFPILIKFLDAREDLSVQVHPDEAYARTHPGAHLKTEAWYVIDAERGSRIYRGVRAGTTRDMLRRALDAGTVEERLVSVTCEPGQCHFLPSGTVHALGAGMLVAEVQTPSDTTFRLFDFNRLDPATGKPRALHIEQSLQCIGFSGAPEATPQHHHEADAVNTISPLVACSYFTLKKRRLDRGVEQPLRYDRPAVWMMLDGRAQLNVADLPEPVTLTRGETILLPAKMNQPVLKTLTDCAWLEVRLPNQLENRL
jgi:mannose-6-phosphate isomerase